MSILERHLEQNIEPNTSKQSYIDQSIKIFQDMKPEDITTKNTYKEGNRYCLNGLFCRMTGFRDNAGFCSDAEEKLGLIQKDVLSTIHIGYVFGEITFEQMRQKAIEYMESLKEVKQ